MKSGCAPAETSAATGSECAGSGAGSGADWEIDESLLEMLQGVPAPEVLTAHTVCAVSLTPLVLCQLHTLRLACCMFPALSCTLCLIYCLLTRCLLHFVSRVDVATY